MKNDLEIFRNNLNLLIKKNPHLKEEIYHQLYYNMCNMISFNFNGVYYMKDSFQYLTYSFHSDVEKYMKRQIIFHDLKIFDKISIYFMRTKVEKICMDLKCATRRDKIKKFFNKNKLPLVE